MAPSRHLDAQKLGFEKALSSPPSTQPEVDEIPLYEVSGSISSFPGSQSSRVAAHLKPIPDSSISALEELQKKSYWQKINVKPETVKIAAEFLAIDGKFLPLTLDTVTRSDNFEKALAEKGQNWDDLMLGFKRWIPPAFLNTALTRYQNVIKRLRDGPETYWWEKGDLKTQFDPLLDLEERLKWGDQLSLWLPDLDFNRLELTVRAQRITNMLAVARSYASKVTDTGDLGQHSFYHLKPIEFSFIVTNNRDLADQRFRLLMGSDEELLHPIINNQMVQSNGNPWWSERLALKWFMMRFNPDVIGPFGSYFQQASGSLMDRLETAARQAIPSRELAQKNPAEATGMKTFYYNALQGKLMNPGWDAKVDGSRMDFRTVERFWFAKMLASEDQQSPSRELNFLNSLEHTQALRSSSHLLSLSSEKKLSEPITLGITGADQHDGSVDVTEHTPSQMEAGTTAQDDHDLPVEHSLPMSPSSKESEKAAEFRESPHLELQASEPSPSNTPVEEPDPISSNIHEHGHSHQDEGIQPLQSEKSKSSFSTLHDDSPESREADHVLWKNEYAKVIESLKSRLKTSSAEESNDPPVLKQLIDEAMKSRESDSRSSVVHDHVAYSQPKTIAPASGKHFPLSLPRVSGF